MAIGGDRGDFFCGERAGDEVALRACSDVEWEDGYNEIDDDQTWRR
jgi:hypothetical protein